MSKCALSRSIGGNFMKAAGACVAIVPLCLLGCEDLSGESAATQQAATAPADPAASEDGATLETEPGARSALGKAKERAERLVNEEVAEYNRKLEEAAEGKYP
ncbi:MAG: hypothetical protein GC172_08260 [Phycisphaera sp.]|jgi:hypothetical protein|nr:hypothetical protein [Phycisphaera sp.]